MPETPSETSTRRHDLAERFRSVGAVNGHADGHNVSAIAEVLGDPSSTLPLDALVRPRRWLRWRWLFLLGVIAAAVALTPAAIATIGRRLHPEAVTSGTTHTVKRGDLLITVTEDGSLESAENLDIKCEVQGSTTIVWIIEDGKKVTKGTELMRLDSSKLAEDVSAQKIALEKARAAAIQSAKDYAAAEIAVREYVEGTFNEKYQEAESKVVVAVGNLRSAENALQHGERMFRKGYITLLQLEAQKTAVERAKLELGTAKISRDVLKRFTRPKTIQELESKRDAAEAKRDGDKAALTLEEAKLKRLDKQLAKCTVRAPQDGLVIYANERMFYGDRDSEFKPGTKVHEEETILRLPDLSRMRAKVGVHEAKVDQIRQGMRARIHVQERDCQGVVVSVANRPDSSFWFSTVKKYPVKVQIDGDSKSLRPGMTAEVEILVDHLKDVISLPVAAVAEKGGQVYCCVKKGLILERRNVVLGKGNDKLVEIKEGVEPGEVVVLNPRSALGEKDEPSQKQAEVNVKDRFGTNKPTPKSDGKGGGKKR
jgi:HlyD family secretion protein